MPIVFNGPQQEQRQQNQRRQQQQGPDIGQLMELYKIFKGGGGSASGGFGGPAAGIGESGGAGLGSSGAGGGSGAGGSSGASGGFGGAGIAGIILAAILAQHQFSNQTDRSFEGQETDDIFGSKPSVTTDPFLGFLSDKLGFEPTQGEKIDAALKNKDYGLALKRTPAGVDIGSDFTFNAIEKMLGKDAARFVMPVQGILKKFEDWF